LNARESFGKGLIIGKNYENYLDNIHNYPLSFALYVTTAKNLKLTNTIMSINY